MTQEEIYQTIKASLKGGGVESNPSLNKALFEASRTLSGILKQTIKAQKPKAQKTEKLADLIRHFIDNPMSPEEEAKGLRAMLHAGIAGGDIPAPLLDRLNQIIGVNSGKDDKIEMVEFCDAFPDYAAAIRLCESPLVVETESKQGGGE